MYKRKRIYLNKKKTRYCTVKLYADKLQMQNDLKKNLSGKLDYYKCLGLHHAYTRLLIKKNGTVNLIPETGTVYLCLQHCGAGIVSHEFLHAVLWAWKHKRNKKQYPIVIKNMKQEEEVLHNHTDAVSHFYDWYWKVEKILRCSKKSS